MLSVFKSWREIEEVLRENAHSVFRALGKPASVNQLERLQKKLGVRLPTDFIQSWKVHDGLRGSYCGQIRLFNYWAFLPLKSIVDVWTTMTDLQAECGFGGSQFPVTAKIKNDTHWRPGWIPFLDADGDKIVMDLDPSPDGTIGQIFEWSNSGSFPMRLLANSYREWLSALAERLSKRQFRLDEYGSIWFD